MTTQLSPQNEQYLAQVVATGLFPSTEAALDAAIVALREKTEPIPFVPDEHMELVERGIESANAGRTKPMTPEFWEDMRRRILDGGAKTP